MKPDRNNRYKKVKIAVIDSGLNDKVKSRYMAQNNIVYKDFTHETRNDSWHGTCCAKIICDMDEEATLYIARIFEKDHADEKEGPIRMAKVRTITHRHLSYLSTKTYLRPLTGPSASPTASTLLAFPLAFATTQKSWMRP
jgi:hypothetical protein